MKFSKTIKYFYLFAFILMLLVVSCGDSGDPSSPGDTTAPTLSAGNVNRTSDTAATIGFTTNEAGTAYYIQIASGTTAPTPASVKAGTSLGAVSGVVSGKAVTLSAGARDIYVIVIDEAGNISNPLKIVAAAYKSSDPDTLESLTVSLLAGDGKITLAPQTAVSGFTFRYVKSGASVAAPAYGANISTITGTTAYTANTDITGANGTAIFVRVYKVNSSSLIIGFGEASATPTATPPTAVSWSAITANGTSNSVSTTQLTLTFSVNPSTIAASNITVTGATRGALTGSGTTRTLAISNISVANGANVTVGITNPAGFTITPSERTVAVNVADTTPPVPGGSGTITTASVTNNSLTLNWTAAMDNVTSVANLRYFVYRSGSNNISTVANAEANGTLLNSGGTLNIATLPVTGLSANTTYYFNVVVVDQAGNKAAYTAKNQATTATAVTWSALTANGTSSSVTTTQLTLTFSVDPTTIAASNITVTGATRGTLTGTGTTRTLAISNITVANGANLTVAITNPSGFTITPNERTVAVNVATLETLTVGLTAGDGKITLAPQTAVSGFTFRYVSSGASVAAPAYGANISTITGATAYTANTDITGANGTAIFVRVYKVNSSSLIVGFGQASATPTAAPPTAVTWSALSANGTSNSVSTTQLTFTFSVNPSSITASNITVTGATKGALSGSGTTRTLAISGITVSNGANITVGITNPAGFTITPNERTVAVNVADTTAPVPGGSGTITTASVTHNSLTLNWTAASDNVTSAANLRYYVYRSGSDNITTVANAETNGTLLNSGGTLNIATLAVTGLSASTTYYFNVVVHDQAGNKVAYITKSQATIAAPTYTINATPNNPAFGSLQTPYTQPAAQTVTITNTGTGAVTLNALPTVTNYTLTALSTTSLAAGGTATFTIRPNASLAVGTYNPTFNVTGSNSTSVAVSPTFAVTAEAKTITVETQGGTLTAGTEGIAYYNVKTTGIANGTYDASVSNLPASVTVNNGANNIAITGGNGTLYLYSKTSTPAGNTTNLQLTITGQGTSGNFSLLIGVPAPAPAIAIASTGLNSLKVGQAVSGATITYTLTNGSYASSITAANFTVSGLPAGLSAAAASRTSGTVVTVSISGTPTTYNASTASITLPTSIPQANVTGATAAITPTGTVSASAVAKGDGAAVSGAPTVSGTPTQTSITVNAVTIPTNPGSQIVEYAISTSTTTPTTGWKAERTFDGLTASTAYRVHARTASNTNYNAGTAQYSALINTATAPSKSITVGSQDKTLTQGTASAFNYTITTTGIAQGTDGTVQWYSSSAGTGTPISAPTGVTTYAGVAPAALGGEALLFGGTTAATPAGTYYFRARIDGVDSNVGTLTVGAAGAKAVTVGTQVGTMTAGNNAATVTYPVTTANIAGGTYTVTLTNAPTGVSVLGTVFINSGSGTLTLAGSTSTVAGTTSTLRITIDGTQSPAFTLVITAPVPTGISFNEAFYIYTWYGKTTDLGMTITPANADRSKIVWETPTTNLPHVINISSTGTGSAEPHIEGTNPNGSSAENSDIFVKAKLPNGNEASIVLRTKFMMNIFSSRPTAPELFMRGEPYNWKREEPNLRYVRAYYAANVTQWSSTGSYLNFETDLSKIQNSNYTITSSDPDITVERDLYGDALDWVFRRTSASVTKSVTLTITVGSQTYKQVVNLSN